MMMMMMLVVGRKSDNIVSLVWPTVPLLMTAMVLLWLMIAPVVDAVSPTVQLGPRPFWLINEMRDSNLKEQLCTFVSIDLSIVSCFWYI
jgi:hypothetical protein